MSFDPAELLQDFDSAKLEALVECMLLAADADGDVSEEERLELTRSIQALAKGSDYEPSLVDAKLAVMLDRAQEQLAADGRAKRIAAVKDRLGDPAACKAALGMAIAVTAADGIVRTSERELIFDLAEGLDVDRDTAADLVRDITRG